MTCAKRRVSVGVFSCLLVAIVAGRANAEVLRAKKDAPWGRREAAHLLRRAGFGGSPDEISRLVELGRFRAVDYVLDFEKRETNTPPYPRDETISRRAGKLFRELPQIEREKARKVLRRYNRVHIEAVRAWWLARMVATDRALEEKMTLFWHGYFTSGFREVKHWQLLYDQNDFLRQHALGDFRTLLVGISQDPAMLIYLDNANNVKSKPNENFARELLELFTMGEGNYTERDVKEGARALTGWGIGPEGFVVRRRAHDNKKKVFMHRRGNFDGIDIIDIILKQDATPRYLGRKLWTFFAYPDPNNAIVAAMGNELRRTNYDVRSAMRKMFRSDVFYSDEAMRAQIKSPIELVVGSLRLLEMELKDGWGMSRACRILGQDLFQPPNVKGWDGGRTWITTSTLFYRYSLAARLMKGSRTKGRPQDATKVWEGLDELPETLQVAFRKLPPPRPFMALQPAYDPLPTLRRHELTTDKAVVAHYVDLLLQTELDQEKLSALEKVLGPNASTFSIDAPQASQRVREMLYVLMSTPEYQLN